MQPTLPGFEGTSPAMATLKLKGTAANRIGAFRFGEEGYAVIKFRVSAINHKEAGSDSVLVREHSGDLIDVQVVTQEEGEHMLTEASMLNDERFGVMSLLGSGGNEGSNEIEDR